MNSKIWKLRKQSLLEELRELERRAAVLRVLAVSDGGAELRAMVGFDTVTLVSGPDGLVSSRGPIIAGLRYHQRFLSEVPIPWEIVSILAPRSVFHPNIDPTGALCLGHPQPAVRLTEIVHMTWAALTFNLRLVDTVEWHGLNPRAAAYVRANQLRLRHTGCGLLEATPLHGTEFAL